MPRREYIRPVRPVFIPISASIAYVELTRGQWALIDRQDAALVGASNWYAYWNRDTRSFYAATNIRHEGRQTQLPLGRLLLGLKPGDKRQGDHENRNTLDNRRCNLRRASRAENARNRGKNRNNTSGVKGVSWYKPMRKWAVKISVDGRLRHVGYFPADQKEAARAAYAGAALSLHGDFARLA